jgi:c-di-GMP-binding flagellar brake protein YcgR
LLDISGGGVGLMATPSLAALLQRGAVLSDCKMTLPDEGLLVASLCVRNKFDVTTKGGSRYVRVGCEFIALPGARMSMVQRYITASSASAKPGSAAWPSEVRGSVLMLPRRGRPIRRNRVGSGHRPRA